MRGWSLEEAGRAEVDTVSFATCKPEFQHSSTCTGQTAVCRTSLGESVQQSWEVCLGHQGGHLSLVFPLSSQADGGHKV